MKIKHTIPIVFAVGLVGSQLAFSTENTTSKQHHNTSTISPSASASSSQSAQGQKIMFSQLPAPVQKTMRSEAPGLNIENVHKISRNGETCYQASFDKAGLKGRLTVAQDGSLLQYQESENYAMFEAAPDLSARGKSKIQLSQLPQAVRQAVTQRAGSNKLGDIFKTTDPQSGKTAYHVSFDDGAALTDLLVDEQGNVLYRADETALYTAPMENSKTLSLQSAPQSVQQAVREHGGSTQTVTDIDKGTWNGKTVYKVMIEKNGAFRPLLVSENGQVIKPGASQSSATGAAASSQRGASESSSSSYKSSNQNRSSK